MENDVLSRCIKKFGNEFSPDLGEKRIAEVEMLKQKTGKSREKKW